MKDLERSTLLIGDLHLGNIHSDIMSFYTLVIRTINNYQPKLLNLVFLGDVIESAGKYRTQVYKILNIEPLYLQKKILEYLLTRLSLIAEGLGTKLKVILIEGNHDLSYHHGNILDNLNIPCEYKVYEHHVILKWNEKRILCIHTVAKSSRGSYLTGWSGYLKRKAIQELKRYKCDIICMGHTHQPMVSMIFEDGYGFIMLPSFLVGEGLGLYHQGLLLTEYGFNIIELPKQDMYSVEEQNIELMRSILQKRRISGEEVI